MDAQDKLQKAFEVLPSADDMEGKALEYYQSEFRKLILVNKSLFLSMLDGKPIEEVNFYYNLFELLSDDPEPWSNYLIRLLERLFASAEEEKPEPAHLEVLSDFGTVSNFEDGPFPKRVRDTCLKHFKQARQATTRYIALQLLENFIADDDRLDRAFLSELYHHPDWRIRIISRKIVNDLEGRSRYAGVSLLDNLRRTLRPDDYQKACYYQP